jgi:hypothetical protein
MNKQKVTDNNEAVRESWGGQAPVVPGRAHLITVMRCAFAHRVDKDMTDLTRPDNSVSAAHTQPG